MLKYILGLFTLLIINAHNVYSQEIDSLSSNSEIFYEQISEILLSTESKTYKKKSEVLLARFHERWSIGRFNKQEKAEVRNLIEKMRTKKMRTYPYLYNYIYSLTLLAESQQLPKSFIAWHSYGLQLLDNKKSKPFDSFLAFTNDLLENERFHRKNSLSWYQRNSRFNFVADSNLLVVFKKGTLVCATKKDSSVIIKTSGVYNYEQKTWAGESGVLEWSRFGEENAKEIYANFNNYSIDVNYPNFTIDSAVLHYNRFFSNPIIGQIDERVKSSPPTKKTSFPRFNAYFDEFELYNIYKDVSFFGGAQLEGLILYGVGTSKSKAILKLTKSDSLFAIVRAEKFKLETDAIISSNAEFVFYFNKDSLYHPSLSIKYTNKNNQFVLFTDKNTSGMIPFFDSYHELDIYVQALFWKMGSPELIFRRIRNVKNRNLARFVSTNYFSQNDFYRLQGIDDIHPLYIIQNYMNIYSDTEIKLNALAQYMEKPTDQVSAMLIDLSNKGFLVYNSRKGVAIIKDRLRYFLDAKSGKIDYDVIELTSNVASNANAIINLNTLDLVVRGVPNVSISDSQEVYIFPYDKTISFKKNRDFTFDGHIHMGLLDFYSRNSTFVYDSFMLKMNYVDSLAFQVRYDDILMLKDSLIQVKNVIEDMVGTIYIDKPFNKSGLRNYAEFPTFVSDDVSYVYYNRKSIQDSTLLADSFYYSVDPFVFDSISTFSTEGLSFEGSLTSAGIFSTIKEPLVINPDYSFGFTHTTPDAGYDLYDGLGKFSSVISLSNNGFKGNGNLEYLSSYSSSNEYIFYPDSLIGTTNDFTVMNSPDKYDFPSAQGDTVNVQWLVDTNVMTLVSDAGPFIVYDNSWLTGNLYLNPNYMRGEGSFVFDQSEIVSNNIIFNYNNLTADTADFFLKNNLNDSLVFDAREYFAKIDFEKQMGWFNNIHENSFMEFPFNNFISTLDEVEWIMNDDKLLLNSNLEDDYKGLDTLNQLELIDYNVYGPEFISIKKEQDSLRFFAGNAVYNLIDYTIDVEKVKLIKVADAAIFPDGEYVKILRDAQIETLSNALIIADTINTYHSIYDADINIFGKNQFTATGWIDYEDRNGMKQPIYLSSISANTKGETAGFGQTIDNEIFFLSPQYYFRGEISMLGSRKNLRFSGGYKLNEDCVANIDNWVSYSQILDPNKIFFDVDSNTVDANGKPAYYGLAYSDDTRLFYPLILEPLANSADKLLVNATGKMIFDTVNNAFSVGSANRFTNGNLQQNFVTLDNTRCIFKGDGNINLGLDLNMITLKSSGYFEHIIINDSTYVNTALLLDFYFDDKAINMMTDSLRLSNAEGGNMSEGLFPMFLRKNLEFNIAEKSITELALYGEIKKMPDQLNHQIIFSELNLYWDQFTRSYKSKGKIGIGYLAGEVVNKYVEGWVQIEKGRTGSSISIYLQPTKNSWYFFNYKNGIMQVLSSDNAFNQRIETIKPEKRILNPESDTEYYEYVTSTRRKSVDFLRKMRSK
jgi:hypothetical protein